MTTASPVGDFQLALNIIRAYCEPIVGLFAVVLNLLLFIVLLSPGKFGRVISRPLRLYAIVMTCFDMVLVSVMALANHWMGDGLEYATKGRFYIRLVTLNSASCILINYLSCFADSVSNFMRLFQILAVLWRFDRNRFCASFYRKPVQVIWITIIICAIASLESLCNRIGPLDYRTDCYCSPDPSRPVLNVVYWAIVLGFNDAFPLLSAFVCNMIQIRRIRHIMRLIEHEPMKKEYAHASKTCLLFSLVYLSAVLAILIMMGGWFVYFVTMNTNRTAHVIAALSTLITFDLSITPRALNLFVFFRIREFRQRLVHLFSRCETPHNSMPGYRSRLSHSLSHRTRVGRRRQLVDERAPLDPIRESGESRYVTSAHRPENRSAQYRSYGSVSVTDNSARSDISIRPTSLLTKVQCHSDESTVPVALVHDYHDPHRRSHSV